MLVMAQTNPFARQGRDADQLHAAGPRNMASQRAAASTPCYDLSARCGCDCVRGMTQRQRQNGESLKTSRGSKTEPFSMLRKRHAFSSPTPSYEGVTNRGGGKRWTGPRPLAVPPCQPTSRRADHFGRRKSVSRFSSSQPPCQRPHHQGQPGEGPDRQYDRAVRQEFHAGEDAA